MSFVQHVQDDGKKSFTIAGDQLHDVVVEIANFNLLAEVENDESLDVENDHLFLEFQRHGLIRQFQDADDKPMDGVGFEAGCHLLDGKVSKQLNTRQFTMDDFRLIAVAEEEEEDRFQLFRMMGDDAFDGRFQIVFGRFLEYQGVADDKWRNTTEAQHSKGIESSTAKGAVVDEAIDEVNLRFAFEGAEDNVEISFRIPIVLFWHLSNEVETTIGGFFWAAEL